MSTAVLSKNKWPFSPQTIPGLTLWLDAADTSSLVLTGSSVTTWKDKSGNGQNVLGYAGSIGQTTLNGNNALNFGSSIMYSPNFVWNSSFTQFFVAQVATGGIIINTQNPGVAYGDYIYTANGTLLNVNNYSTNSPIIQLTDSAYSLGTTVVPYNQWFIFCIGYNSTGTSAVNYTINGITHSTSVYAGSGGSVLNQALNLYINGSPSGSLATGTLLGEIIHFNSSITTLQRQQVEGYLAQKWGLQTSLPISHPYSLSSVNSFPGLQLWLDASDPTGNGSFLTNGGSVSTWTDKSGLGNNMSLVSGTVTYNATSGVPSVSFASGGILQTSNYISLTTSTVVFVVAQATSVPGGLGYLLAFSDINTGYAGDFSIRFYNTGTGLYNGNFGDVGYPVGYYINGTLNQYSYGNTTTIPSGYNIIEAVSTSQSGSTRVSLSSSFGNRYFVGNIQEVIIFSSLTTSQRQQIEGYLAWKWGLQGSLSSSQPYYSSGGYIFPNKYLYSRPFQPVDITGCQFWLDAADTTSLVLSGTSVTTWKDKSGNAYNATGGVSPTYVSNSQNGLGIVSFNGANNYLLSSLTINAASHTMFIVHNPTYVNTSDKNNDTSILRFQNTLGFIVFPYNNGARYGYINSFGPSGIFGQLPEGDVAGVYNIIDAVIASGSQQTYRNGSLVASYNATLNSTSSDTLSLGAFGVSPYQQQYYGGSVAEIIIYDSPLTTSQRQQVESYLAWKWGLRTILPSTSSGYLLPSYSVMFTPKTIQGLQLWLDAADISTYTSSSSVSLWGNKGYAGGSATLKQGTVNSTSATINGLPAMSFSSNTYMDAPSLTFNQTTRTAFVVVTTGSPGYNYYFLVQDYTSTSTTNLALSTYYDGTYTNLEMAYYAHVQFNVTTPSNVFNTTSIICGTTLSTYAGIFVNGVFQTPYSIYNVYPFGTGTTTTQGIGYYGGSAPFIIGEVLIFDGAITTAQRQQVEGYLAWKWGIQSSLPSTHAFAKISP